MERYYERQLDIDPDSDLQTPTPESRWDTIVCNRNLQGEESPTEKAKNELKKYYNTFEHSIYLPKMEPKNVLGALDNNGHPKAPVYGLVPVAVVSGGRGKDLPSKRNHADYVEGNGNYDIVKYLVDHKKEFPALHSVGVGELCPHLSTEVDCESLFSLAGFKSHPRRTQTDICNYERLVVTKHRSQSIHILESKVKALFWSVGRVKVGKRRTNVTTMSFLRSRRKST